MKDMKLWGFDVTTEDTAIDYVIKNLADWALKDKEITGKVETGIFDHERYDMTGEYVREIVDQMDLILASETCHMYIGKFKDDLSGNYFLSVLLVNDLSTDANNVGVLVNQRTQKSCKEDIVKLIHQFESMR